MKFPTFLKHPNLRDVCLSEATILCAEGERRSLNLDLVALNTAAGVKFDEKPSGLRDFTELKSFCLSSKHCY